MYEDAHRSRIDGASDRRRVAPAAALTLGVLARRSPSGRATGSPPGRARDDGRADGAKRSLGTGSHAGPSASLSAPSAADLAGVLPPGATSVEESYQDWAVVCQRQAAAEKCAMTETQIDPQSKQRIVDARTQRQRRRQRRLGRALSAVRHRLSRRRPAQGGRRAVGRHAGVQNLYAGRLPRAGQLRRERHRGVAQGRRLGIDVVASQTASP